MVSCDWSSDVCSPISNTVRLSLALISHLYTVSIIDWWIEGLSNPVPKLKSNLQEVRARGGQLIVFADEKAGMTNGEGTHVINMPHIHDTLSPILYTIPLQLLSYYVAVLKGTDVDQPRNLAKSVTVE